MTSTTNGTKLIIFFSGKHYEIPQFQRDYSWTKDQITEFWEDAKNVYDENVEDYFFGPMVLIKKNTDEPLRIVDGQQRTITLTILMILIRDICRSEGNEKDAMKIESLLQFEEIGSTEVQPALILNQSNNTYFLESIFPYDSPTNKIKIGNPVVKTNEKILDAYKKLYEFIKIKFKIQESQEIAKFLQSILKRFEVMEIVVDNEQYAYRIFATLNQRGLDLSIADLVKNYLLEIGGQRNMNSNHTRWKEIVNKLESAKLDVFLRHHWMAHHGYVSTQKLYDKITKNIKTSNDVLHFLQKLDGDCILYQHLKYPSPDFWGKEDTVHDVKALFQDLKNDSAQPLFLMADKKWDRKDVQKLPKICLNIHFRAKTLGTRSASDMVHKFVESAIIVQNGGDLEKVKEVLKELDISNEQFKSQVYLQDFSGSIAKHLLSKIEDKKFVLNPSKHTNTETTLEHILPQTMSDDWKKVFSNEDQEKYLNRIGNLTLIHLIPNSEMQNKSFEEKKRIYKTQKDIEITKTLSEEPKWDVEAIEKRSKDFAGDAVDIWTSLID